MIRYRYVNLQPPAPFVHLSVRCPTRGNQLDTQPAIIDPAADRLAPESVSEYADDE